MTDTEHAEGTGAGDMDTASDEVKAIPVKVSIGNEGSLSCVTALFDDQDHTLGNALRHVIMGK